MSLRSAPLYWIPPTICGRGAVSIVFVVRMMSTSLPLIPLLVSWIIPTPGQLPWAECVTETGEGPRKATKIYFPSGDIPNKSGEGSFKTKLISSVTDLARQGPVSSGSTGLPERPSIYIKSYLMRSSVLTLNTSTVF